jgi:hypothetical protein
MSLTLITKPIKRPILLGDNYTQIQGFLNDWLQSVAYWETELEKYPNSENVKQQLLKAKAWVATYQKMLSKGKSWVNNIGKTATNEAQNIFSTYYSPLQNLQQYQNQQQIIPGEENILDTFTTSYAGLPLWAWIGIVGAGVYFIFGNKKKTK